MGAAPSSENPTSRPTRPSKSALSPPSKSPPPSPSSSLVEDELTIPTCDSLSSPVSSTQDGYLLFVYGTLKRSFPNSVHMETCGCTVGATTNYLCDAITVAPMPLVIGPYGIPFLLDMPGRHGAHRVCGELYSVSPDALAFFDDFEGTTDAFYKRVLISVRRYGKQGPAAQGDINGAQEQGVECCGEETSHSLEDAAREHQVEKADNVFAKESAGHALAWTYVRHPEGGGGLPWAREWTVDRLSLNEFLEQYSLEHAKSYVARELRESPEGYLTHDRGTDER